MRICEAKVWKAGDLYPVRGFFHQWGIDYEEFESGPGNYTVAVIELDDGTVVMARADTVKFVEGLEDAD